MMIVSEVEEVITPDDWASIEPKVLHFDQSAELQRQVDEFLAQGGKVKELRPGESALVDSSTYFVIPAKKAAEVDPGVRLQREKEQLKKLSSRMRKDSAIIAKINAALDGATTQKALVEDLNTNVYTLQRVLRDHFSEDPRADRFQKRTIDQKTAAYEATVLPKVREAIANGMKGMHRIAEYCGTNYLWLLAASKKHKLDIPHEMGGRKAGESAGVYSHTRKYAGRVACLNTACDARLIGSCFYCPSCGHVTAKGKAAGVE